MVAELARHVDFDPDGTEATRWSSRPVPSESNRHRIEAVTDGWLIVDRNTVYTVSAAGVVGASNTVPRVQSVERGNGELWLVGLSGARAPIATRVTETGATIEQHTLDAPVVRVPVDAAAWTGTQWLVTYVDDPHLDDQGVLAAFCQEDL